MGAKVRPWRMLSVAVVAALVLGACGDDEEEAGTGGQQSGKVAKIGAIVPLSGDLAAVGAGIRNSVELAIRQANDRNVVPGWRLQIDARDDEAKADVGARQATALASDRAVVGVVGTYNSSVAQQTIPILDRAGIVQVSPANTNDTLTRGENFRTSPTRPHQNYFRTATLDSLQGGFAADYVRENGIETAVLIHDKKTYGQGLVEAFRARFERNGGRVLGDVETVTPGDKDFSGVLSKIRPRNAQLIFYGGEYPEASLISSQAKQQGLRVPLMGGDGIVDKTYTQVAGAAAENDLGTSVGAPPEQLASARGFIDAYNAAGFRDAHSAYGALAYDAANAIINAFAKAVAGKDAVDEQLRRAVITEVGATDLDGASGKVRFDQYGDTVTRTLTVYRVTGGEWKPIKTGEAAG